ncbi:MAG: hypothetical protein CME88_13260 [Hirschia sp.]|nr:hypothetical protein [Hirschia sp.]MBF19338.1 hypothetical protein [Hirschia sp.]|tara:strand:+ start:113 stop:448 length:336 start_codon:yes stop_codon:yes gene_type:complete
MTELVKRIKCKLEECEFSPRAASLKAGLNSHFLQKLFADPSKGVSTTSLYKLAPVLQTSVEWLVSGNAPEVVFCENSSFSELVDIWRELSEARQKELLDFANFLKSRDPSE